MAIGRIRGVAIAMTAAALAGAAPVAAQPAVKIGVIAEFSGPFADSRRRSSAA